MLIGGPKRPNRAAFLWPAALVVWGPGSASSLHRHHCVQLVLAFRETLRVRERARRPWKTCGGVLIRPDASHEVDGRNTDVLMAFVDPEGELGTALLDRIAGEVAILSPRDVAEWRSLLISFSKERCLSHNSTAALDDTDIETAARWPPSDDCAIQYLKPAIVQLRRAIIGSMRTARRAGT
jgi:hypothetical protein